MADLVRSLSAGSQRHSNRPAPVEGTSPLNGRTLLLLMRLGLGQLTPPIWGLLGLNVVLLSGAVYVISRAAGDGLAWWAALLIAGGIVLPFVSVVRVGVLFWWRLRGWLVGYFDDTTSLLVHRDRDGHWLITDHMTTRPHRGVARPLRQLVFTHLAWQADCRRAIIVLSTYSAKLAKLYVEDMPGLEIVGTRRDWLGRSIHLLRRDPSPGGRTFHVEGDDQ